MEKSTMSILNQENNSGLLINSYSNVSSPIKFARF